ncbi:MAG: ribbon-helix-helix protein, CopG family [Thermoanaerobaculia bacterium]|nr:MAG: ribbon-helix-helix protein, CopG family [Thermoanaerobaculia bacterium]MBZ0102671.1 ribbon-helix-helix domain-containing protein [Thermoanaerobaculia bacterium]
MTGPAPHPSRSNARTRPTTVSLPHELLRQIDATCREQRVTRSQLVRLALAQFLDDSERPHR